MPSRLSSRLFSKPSLQVKRIVKSFRVRVLHINRSGPNHTQQYTRLLIRYVIGWEGKNQRNFYKTPTTARMRKNKNIVETQNDQKKKEIPYPSQITTTVPRICTQWSTPSIDTTPFTQGLRLPSILSTPLWECWRNVLIVRMLYILYRTVITYSRLGISTGMVANPTCGTLEEKGKYVPPSPFAQADLVLTSGFLSFLPPAATMTIKASIYLYRQPYCVKSPDYSNSLKKI